MSSATRRRLPRINGAERASTARARCRACRNLIEKGTWRIPLVFYEGGRFNPSGFVHVRCAQRYFETNDVIGRLAHFARDLSDDDLEQLQAELIRTVDAPPGS
jgi:hypothetical protein